ncbi:MAG: porin [Cellvibrionaceae bacterium]|nr:porin [Cellvibrionaceae bacterium]
MKFNRKLLATSIAASMIAAASVPAAYAEIELGEGLSVSGFLDMSYVYSDADGVDSTDKTFGIDQFEMDFFYAGSDGVSAQVDIEYGESGTGNGEDETFVEQAFITKKFNDQFSVKAGRFLSNSGWETEEPTGLYQYSGTGYGQYFYGGYQQGVSASYDVGAFQLMASVVNSAFDPVERDTTTLATELGVAISPVEGLTAKLFYIQDEETDLINFWTSYAVSSFTFAFEYNVGDYGDTLGLEDVDGDGYLLMANYAVGNFGITVRYHDYSIEGSDAGQTITLDENSAITISPSYKVGDNLLLVAEYRMDEFGDQDVNTFALEALFTF